MQVFFGDSALLRSWKLELHNEGVAVAAQRSVERDWKREVEEQIALLFEGTSTNYIQGITRSVFCELSSYCSKQELPRDAVLLSPSDLAGSPLPLTGVTEK